MIAVVWSLWGGRNNRTFSNQSLSEELVWDKVVHLASLWIWQTESSQDFSSNLRRDWKALLKLITVTFEDTCPLFAISDSY